MIAAPPATGEVQLARGRWENEGGAPRMPVGATTRVGLPVSIDSGLRY